MRIPPSDLAQLRTSLEQAKDILVVTHKNPTIDSLAACLSLYLTLPRMGKRVTVLCPDKVTVEVADLVGIDKVTNVFGSKNFVISLDYVEGSIEKVSYNIEGEKFNLVIEPRPGFTFSQDKVRYSSSIGSADLVIVVNTPGLGDLGPLASSIEELVNRVDCVTIDVHAHNERFGKVNLVYPGMGSVSEVVTFLLSDLKVFLDVDSATNLLQGIADATVNFASTTTTPDSFEAAALLMRAGAQKGMTKRVPPEKPFTMPGTNVSQQGFPQAPSFVPRPQAPKPYVSQQPQRAAPTPSFPEDFDQPIEETPPDWLKPKIFTSKGPQQPARYVPSGDKGRTA